MSRSVIPGSVVVGVDGAPHTSVALEWAVDYAVGHHRPLTIVHAAGGLGRLDTFGDVAKTRRALRMAGRRVTDTALGVVRRLAPDLEVAVHLPLLEPRPALLAAAEDAHLLVVGTHGRGSVATFLLGSVSVGVSRHACCSVVVARTSGTPRDPEEFAGRVVVGVDGSPASESAVELAFALASWKHKPLAAVHAWGADGGYVDLVNARVREEVTVDHGLQMAETLAGFAEKYPDVVVTEHQLETDAAAALVWASQSAAAVVVGSRGRGGAATLLLGSVGRTLLEHAHCTVAVARSAPVKPTT